MSEIIRESTLDRASHRLRLGAWPLEFIFEGSLDFCRDKLAKNASNFIGSTWSLVELLYQDEQSDATEKEQTSGRISRSQSGKIKLMSVATSKGEDAALEQSSSRQA